ncbi:MAG TPA: hypothetical protein VMT61_03030 [Candidatus Binataceae bacterium]|nr:hypothetical protein [Candidatus Binataceae bacterium]
MRELADWNSFYEIVGSAAGALIGLQFVVLTLVAERAHAGTGAANAAFGTPTIVHFGTVLFLSALIRAPWHRIVLIASIWGIVGLAGIFYAIVVARRMQRQTAYQAQFEDWLFHLLLPLGAYAILLAAVWFVPAHPGHGLFAVGAAVLLLLFVGIHNAWDSIAYHVSVRGSDAEG